MSYVLLPLQQYWPVGTVGVWWGLAVYQIYRDRYRTWTEAFFLAGCIFLGAYALADVFFFTAPTQDLAVLFAKISFSVLTLGVVFFFLFALVFHTHMRRAYLVATAPAAALIVIVWWGLVTGGGVRSLTDPLNPQPPWIGSWNQSVFGVWVVGSLLYGILAAYFLLRTYREVADQTTTLRRRMFGLLATAVTALALGVLTNVFRGFTGLQILPLFSTGLALPGIVSVLTLSPSSTERFSVAVRRWKASRYDIKASFVIFADGTLIGSKVKPGEKVIDQDLFGATLDVIQNFMRTSFPTLRGSLSAIRHGDFTLVVERGKFAYLTIILQGEENDQLRRHMRDILLKYEHDNQPVLADWRGIPAEAVGTETMLTELMEGS